MVRCGGGIAAHCGASRSCDFMPRGIVAGEISRKLAHALAPIDRHMTARGGQTRQRRSQSHPRPAGAVSAVAANQGGLSGRAVQA